MPAYDDDGSTYPAPVATALVRHPDDSTIVSDVRMLIDTGADTTLLPRLAVQSLGLVASAERYLLEEFDGALREAEAVHAVLVLENRSFRGLFLLVDSEVGVLGRNTLNHFRLLLDGSSLDWRVLSTTDDVS